jgi:hypothetical protein
MRTSTPDTALYALRNITREKFLYFGISQVVYLKVGLRDAEQVFVIYAADGRPLEAFGTIEDAWERIDQSGFGLVTVH